MKIVCDFAYATNKIVTILFFVLATIAVERVLKFNKFIQISAYAILKLRVKFNFFSVHLTEIDREQIESTSKSFIFRNLDENKCF